MRGLPVFAFLALLIAAPSQGVWAAGTDSGEAGAPEIQASHQEGLLAIEGKRWDDAIKAFRFALVADGQNADVFNYLAYAHRKKGDLDTAFKYYAEALRLDPKHLGAHEYIAEAYLARGNLAKAEEHLAILDDLCFFGCEEYDDLKAVIANYRAKGG